MVKVSAYKQNEYIKHISDWLFFPGIIFILIGILILIVLLPLNYVEFNLFLISNMWSLGFLIMGLISIIGGAIIYTIRSFVKRNFASM